MFHSKHIPILQEPRLFDLVTRHMLHGMCGPGTNAPCMTGKKCCKNFPKRFCDETTLSETGGSPIYKRPDNGRIVKVKQRGIEYSFDSRRVVPHNAYLLVKFECHINVEIVASSNVAKYLYMYITKGADRVLFSISKLPTPTEAGDSDVQQTEDEDEIKV